MLYDFPLSPKARTYLKFESVFRRAEACQMVRSKAEIMCLLRAIVDYMDLIDGAGGFKIEILKDLEKLDQKLRLWAMSPDIDADFMQQLQQSLARAFDNLSNFSRQRTVLRDDPILETIKPRFLTPSGVNCFDTPLFTFWTTLSQQEQLQQVRVWLQELENIRSPVSIILYMWRLCAEFSSRTAVRGFLKEAAGNADLLEIKLPDTLRMYPVVSGFQASINVRFLPYDKGVKSSDVTFDMAFLGTSIL